MIDSLTPRDPGDSMVAVVAGTAALRVTEVSALPHEPMPRAEARMRGARMIQEVRAFVAGSLLAGLVEIDLLSRRARVTLALAPSLISPVVACSIPSARLALTTAAEVVDLLRMRLQDLD